MLFGNDRAELRQVFFQTWEKFNRGESLEGTESLLIDIIHRHPEYHEVVSNPDAHLDQDYTPEKGQTNPFLHMGMHLTIAEQVGMDRPPGIRAAYEQLASNLGDTHSAEHQIMECLGEALWEAQQRGELPDEGAYLECVQRLAHDSGGPRRR